MRVNCACGRKGAWQGRAEHRLPTHMRAALHPVNLPAFPLAPCPILIPPGLWLQCDECDAWMHGACLGLRRAPPGEFVCGACQRARAAAEVTQDCGATLIVVPTPILHQW